MARLLPIMELARIGVGRNNNLFIYIYIYIVELESRKMRKMSLKHLFFVLGVFLLLLLLLQMVFRTRENFEEKSEKSTITCVKGKTTKKVTGKKCPSGYKQTK